MSAQSKLKSPVQPIPSTETTEETEKPAETPAPAQPDPHFWGRLFLEDFVVTSLLASGRALRAGELAAKATGFSPSRRALREVMEEAQRVDHSGRDWELHWRLSRAGQTREERSRQPISSMIAEVLLETGRPLPLPVIAREVSLMRHEYDPKMRETVANVLKTARFALEISSGVFIHRDFVLETGAPNDDLLIRENRLQHDPDFAELRDNDVPEGKNEAERALAILKSAGKPLKIKLLAFLVRRAAPESFQMSVFVALLNDRAKFQPLLDGHVFSVEQLSLMRGKAQNLLAEFGGGQGAEVNVAELLKQRVAASEIIAPKPEYIEELKKNSRASEGQPVSLENVMLDVWELEPEDPRFVPSLQGLNDALRREPAFMPVGIGRFLLRESVPDYLGSVPAILRPITLQTRSRETDDPADFEMSDEGLEGDCAEFVHDPKWGDIAEEVEVKLGRKLGSEAHTETRYIVLNHHFLAGTLKLRRMDEDFFEMSGSVARIPLSLKETGENLVAWASKESGLLYGFSDFYQENLPPSGGVLDFSRASGRYLLQVGEPDKLTVLSAQRAEELENLREPAKFWSVYELLQKVMGTSANLELPSIWAQINTVRRTSKRLMCSVLCGYHCFYFKQRGPKQLLWRFDEAKLEQGFKRNKRKFVRR